MKLTKYELVRDNQRCVLQGMIHIGSPSLYSVLQKDLDKAVSSGFDVFFEGVKGYPKISDDYTEEEVKIRDFFKFLFDLFPELADAFGFVLQKKHIRYPADAINADVTFSNMVVQLYNEDFEQSLLFRLFEKEDFRKKAREQIESIRSLPKEESQRLFNKKMSLRTRFLRSLLMRKLESVILRWRNGIAVKILEYCFKEHGVTKAFVHYGEAHMKEMAKFLKKNGWSIIQKSTLDLSQFL